MGREPDITPLPQAYTSYAGVFTSTGHIVGITLSYMPGGAL